MRIIYIDIDTLRADHLSCYGYHRKTSPVIDSIAHEGITFSRCYASDTPCLPSRTALTTGRFGICTGVINHGGIAADPFHEGASRNFCSRLNEESFAMKLRAAGLRTTTISTFGERHSALHWHAGYNEVINIGGRGMESAHEVLPEVLSWLKRNADRDHWFLHFHLWDPHTPYRAPADFGNPFANQPIPSWLTDTVRKEHWKGFGPHSAQEVTGFDAAPSILEKWPRQPHTIDSMSEVRRMFDGYDTGIRYADEHVGQLIKSLKKAGIYDSTAIMISSDHGETLGEFNIYGDHQTADEHTHHIPMIMRWPGLDLPLGGLVNSGLHYQFDVTATVLQLLDVDVPTSWNGKGFAESITRKPDVGREHLILSQGAWTCQRAVRWDRWLCIRTYHDGYHGFPDIMLFDIQEDPHQQFDLSSKNPDLVTFAMARLESWHTDMMRTSPTGIDPMWSVLHEGGPFHVRGHFPKYLKRLEATNRGDAAMSLRDRHLDTFVSSTID
jgi:choline-sulfatase